MGKQVDLGNKESSVDVLKGKGWGSLACRATGVLWGLGYQGLLMAGNTTSTTVTTKVTDLNSVVNTVLTPQITSVGSLISLLAYVSGILLSVVGILMFKQQREQQTQVSLSKPITILAVAAALLFLPSVLDVAGQSVFGQSRSNISSQANAVLS